MSSAPKLPNAVRFSPTVRWANKYANMGSNANMYAAVVALTLLSALEVAAKWSRLWQSKPNKVVGPMLL